jgi:hypothetical protein
MATEKRLKGYDPITLESFTRHMTKHREPYDQYDMGYVDAVDQIENFLEYNTVDAVEVIHAHWIPDDYYDICSHCNHSVVLHDRRKPDRYCRNCGADMRGNDNGDRT